MEHVIKFDLPDEENELTLAINGSKYWCILWDLSQHLREKLKYCELTDEQEKVYEEIRDLMYDLMGSKNVSFDDIP